MDAESTDYFFQCVQDELENGVERVVVNCADLGYVSSVGLGMLVRARSRIAAAGGKINLARIDSNVLKVIRLVNLDRLFSIFETERAAIDDMEKDFA